MADYNPQARRSRPSPSEESPVDDLLGVIGSSQPNITSNNPLPEASSGEFSLGGEDHLADDEDQVRPFDAPPVEVADERTDLVNRFGVLAALVGLVAVLTLRRRRRAG